MTLDLNARSTMFANVYMCTLPTLVIILLPVLVTGVYESFSVSEQMAGFVVGTDMLGFTLGTAISFFYLNRLLWHRIALVSLLLMIAANVLSAMVGDYTLLLICRFLSGIGAGFLTAVTLAAMGQSRDPDAAYGYWLALQAVMGGLGFMIFPSILETWGVGGAFFLFAMLCVPALGMVRFVPDGAPQTDAAGTSIASFPRALLVPVIIGLLALFCFDGGLMLPFTYIDRLGVAAGFSIDQTSMSLSFSTIGGLVGGLLAAYVGAKYGRRMPIVLGIIILISALLALRIYPLSYLMYTISVVCIFGVWSFVLPYLFGVLAHLDSSGRSLSLGGTVNGAAVMLGPFVGALMIGSAAGQHELSDYYPLLFAGAGLLVLCAILTLAASKEA